MLGVGACLLTLVYMAMGQTVDPGTTVYPLVDFPIADAGNVSALGFAAYAEVTGRVGYSMANLGDINGDGQDDLALGHAYTQLNSSLTIRDGRVVVLLSGQATPTLREDDLATLGYEYGFVITPPVSDENQLFGEVVVGGGDYNDDGQPDLLIGAKGGYSQPGAVYLIWGRTDYMYTDIDVSNMTADVGITIPAPEGYESKNFGMEIQYIGDFDGDEIDDFLLVSTFNSGTVWVVYGHEGSWEEFVLSNSTSLELVFVDDEGSRMGTNVGRRGDFNGDEQLDLVLWRDMGSDVSATLVLYGGSFPYTGTVDLAVDDWDGFTITDKVVEGNQGKYFGDLCDINGDGLSDLILGGADENSGLGEVYVLFGTDNMTDMVFSYETDFTEIGFKVTGVDGSKNIGKYGGCLGDLDGDAHEDFFFYLSGYTSMLFFGKDGPHSNTNSSLSGSMSDGYRSVAMEDASIIVNAGTFGGLDLHGIAATQPGTGDTFVYTNFTSPYVPTESPTTSPTDSPSESPTLSPSMSPTNSPTVNPTVSPTMTPSVTPTATPTIATDCDVSIVTQGGDGLSWDLTDDEGDEEIASGELADSSASFTLGIGEDYLLFLSASTLPSSATMNITVNGDSRVLELPAGTLLSTEIAGLTCEGLVDKISASDSGYNLVVGVLSLGIALLLA